MGNNFLETLKFLLIFTISSLCGLIWLPTIIMILITFWIYRQMVSYYLAYKHGKDFRGILKFGDPIHTLDPPTKSVTNSIGIFSFDEEAVGHDFFTEMKLFTEKMWHQNAGDYDRFKFTYDNFMGYSYRLKYDRNPDDFLGKLKTMELQGDKMNMKELVELMTDACNEKLPDNERGLWQILVGMQPLQMEGDLAEKDSNKKLYPVLFKIHHSITDGVGMIKTLIEMAEKSPNISAVKPPNGKKKSATHWVRLESFFVNLKTVLFVLGMHAVSSFVQIFCRGHDSNSLYGIQLSGRRYLGFAVDETKEYVKKVKWIKNKIPGAHFPQVILTAYSASLHNYYKKKFKAAPNEITALTTVTPSAIELPHLIPGVVNPDRNKFKNGFAMILLNLPIAYDNKKSSLTDILKAIIEDSETIKNRGDYYVNISLTHCACAILPRAITRLFLETRHCTSIVSVLPGLSKVTYSGGNLTAKHFGFWVPNFLSSGISFSSMTYDDYLHFGLNVDTALIQDPKEAQEIVEDVFRYIDVFKAEVEAAS